MYEYPESVCVCVCVSLDTFPKGVGVGGLYVGLGSVSSMRWCLCERDRIDTKARKREHV